MSDEINRPSHYTNHPSGIECCEIVRHLHGARSHAYKYLFRRKQKNSELQNLEKALWWIDDLIANPAEDVRLSTDLKSKIRLIADFEPLPFGPLLNVVAMGEEDELRLASVALSSIIKEKKQ